MRCSAPFCPTPGAEVVRCTYRGCTTPATDRIDPPNGGTMHWHGCPEHMPGMVEAFKYGCAADLSGTLHPLEPSARLAPLKAPR